MAYNLQDAFFQKAKKEGCQVVIYLVNGFQIRGIIKGFDTFTILVELPDGGVQLIFKHAISTLNAGKNISAVSIFNILREQTAVKEVETKGV